VFSEVADDRRNIIGEVVICELPVIPRAKSYHPIGGLQSRSLLEEELAGADEAGNVDQQRARTFDSILRC
jgi:hypothetical protein